MIVVEDGSVVADANSYVSIADFKEFCNLRGFDIPTTDAEIEALLHRGMDWLEALEFKGRKKEQFHTVEFPRVDLYVDGFIFPSNKIPQQIVKAQCYCAYYSNTADLTPVSQGKETKKEKVDVIEVEYQEGSYSTALDIPHVYKLLNGFIKSSTIVTRI